VGHTLPGVSSPGQRWRLRRPEGHGGAPRLLALITYVYLAWWIVPIAVAVRASFSTTDAALPQGFTTEWYRAVIQDPGLREIFLRTLRLASLTALIATPLGAAMALGIDRWRSRASTIATGVVVLAVATPQIALAVAFFLLFGFLFTFVGLDVRAQLLTHVTLAIPFVVVIVRARLTQLGNEYEEMAMDLGASPAGSIGRVLMPLTAPAVVAAAVVAFTLSFDNLVLSNAVCLRLENCATVPILMYASAVGHAASPDIYAVATLALLVSVTGFGMVLAAVRLMRSAYRSVG
jgi:spermidine/putrescine transport system permease protein